MLRQKCAKLVRRTAGAKNSDSGSRQYPGLRAKVGADVQLPPRPSGLPEPRPARTCRPAAPAVARYGAARRHHPPAPRHLPGTGVDQQTADAGRRRQGHHRRRRQGHRPNRQGRSRHAARADAPRQRQFARCAGRRPDGRRQPSADRGQRDRRRAVRHFAAQGERQHRARQPHPLASGRFRRPRRRPPPLVQHRQPHRGQRHCADARRHGDQFARTTASPATPSATAGAPSISFLPTARSSTATIWKGTRPASLPSIPMA